MAKNMGTIDRALRVIVGIIMLVMYFTRPEASWLWLIGIVPLATGLLGSCPAYSIFGMNTCGTKR